jgi:D-alanine-D-alanine ligase
MTLPKIALVYSRVDPGASNDEKDILVQVNAVRAALHALGHATIDVPLSLDLGVAAAVLRTAGPVIAFNLAETIDGKGSLIQLAPTLLESLRIPYTGAPCEAILLTSHKLLGKKTLEAGGISTPRWAPAAQAADRKVPFPGPWIVKSVWEHASIGLEDSAVARSEPDLTREIRRRTERESIEHLFVEAYIEGREFNLALLDGADMPQSLPPAEIVFVDYPEGKPKMVGYRAKWDEASFEYGSTPRRFDFPPGDAPLVEKLVAISRDCWRLFGLKGYARVDFRVDAEGRPWVLEINTNPCISPDAGFMAAAGRAGLTLEEVVSRIVAAAAHPSGRCDGCEESDA